MFQCYLAWYRWWIYWNRKDCRSIKEAVRTAFMQLWRRRVRQRLDQNAKDGARHYARSWSELAFAVDRDLVNVNRYVMDTLLALNYATALGVEPCELLPSREEWLTRVVGILLSVADEQANLYVRYMLMNPRRLNELDAAVLGRLLPEKRTELEKTIQKVASSLEPVLKKLILGVN